MAAPSPITKPQRSTLNGRDDFSGLSLNCVASAFIFMNPPTANSQIVASVPPATTTSARPARMRSSDTPSASVELAHAVTITCAGPFAPSVIDTLPAASFAMSSGMASGERRSGPRSSSVFHASPFVSMPPMPLPRIVATRSMSGFFSSV